MTIPGSLSLALQLLPSWCQVFLTTDRNHRVRLTSSSSLASAVQQLQQTRSPQYRAAAKTSLTPVMQFNPEVHATINLLELLHCIGRATTNAYSDPLGIAEYWPVLAYSWAFASPPSSYVTSLRLSLPARTHMDFHQKALLSDYLGAGMSCHVMSRYFGTPQLADTYLVLRQLNSPVARTNTSIPDYIFYDTNQQSIYIVECKGTQSSYSAMKSQLCTAAKQVASIRVLNGPQPIRLVIGTHISGRATTVYLLDPPSDDSLSGSPQPRRARRTTRFDIDASHTAEAVRRAGRAKLLAFAGARSDAARQLPRWIADDLGLPISSPDALTPFMTTFGEFDSTRQVLLTRDGVQIEVVRGLLAEYRRYLNETSLYVRPGELPEHDEPPRSYLSHFPDTSGESQFFVTADERDGSIRSFARDGTLLSLRLSPQSPRPSATV